MVRMVIQIHCNGRHHQYTASGGTGHSVTDRVVHYVPEGVDHILMADLKPSFNYTCTVIAQYSSDQTDIIGRIVFATLPAGGFIDPFL